MCTWGFTDTHMGSFLPPAPPVLLFFCSLGHPSTHADLEPQAGARTQLSNLLQSDRAKDAMHKDAGEWAERTHFVFTFPGLAMDSKETGFLEAGEMLKAQGFDFRKPRPRVKYYNLLEKAR